MEIILFLVFFFVLTMIFLRSSQGSNLLGTGQNRSQPRVERPRFSGPNKKYPRTGEDWTYAEEQRLKIRRKEGASIDRLAREFERTPRAIRMRLQKLGLR